ncbi:hypothetical protein DPMN_104718 [Dreissena polymorpha]|uniref:Uncharacterized protein n=1 Tax=Dreissena polymorpha TaxID=45954 RepID=A0A9D4H8A5_DREPO|nr:hypothetical protein DPMN_104718 [Dreissena polymorpha]
MWQMSALHQFAPVQSSKGYIPPSQCGRCRHCTSLHQFSLLNAIDRLPNVADVGTAPVCTSSVVLMLSTAFPMWQMSALHQFAPVQSS